MPATATPDGHQYTYHVHGGDGNSDSSSLLISSTIATATATDTAFLDKEIRSRPPTLEEMILQLEVEEEIARKAKLREYGTEMQQQRRMSCVNNSDILRSARNALNQYPRFSLDGKDAMYRSSFRNLQAQAQAQAQAPPVPASARKSISCNRERGRGSRSRYRDEFESKWKSKLEKRRTTSSSPSSCLPTSLGGESVIWCKAGVVAKLMGLEVMPVPVVSTSTTPNREKYYLNNSRQNLRTRPGRAQSHEMERRRSTSSSASASACHVTDIKNVCRYCCSTPADTKGQGTRTRAASCSKMRPLAGHAQPTNENIIDGVGWPIPHFL